MRSFNTIFITLIFFPSISFAMCPQQARHFYSLNVTTCDVTRFNSSDGISFKGKVLKSKYEWGNKEKPNFKESNLWKIGETKTVYLNKVSKDYCKRKTPFIIHLEGINRCCDTRPAKGNCLLPRLSWFSIEQ